jgi:uncharacterized protein YbcV (DUF1398 family)
MFTIQQIKTAHARVKSGADFPAYIQDLIKIGVVHYETYVADGHTLYFGNDNFSAQSEPKYATLSVANTSDKNRFQIDLKEHQQGKTDYQTFCLKCATSGIEKWVVNTIQMTCIYFNKQGIEILKEEIPKP